MLNFQTLFESLPGLYIVYSLDFVIVAGSNAYFQATKTKREEVIGRFLFDVFPDNPDDPNANGVQNLRASLESVLKHRKAHTMAVQKYDIRRPESEGGGFEERYWTPINSPVFDENGVMTHIIHRAEDVTEFVRVQQQRNEQRQLNQALQSRTDQMEIEIYLRAQELQEVNEQLQAANEALSELDHAKTLFFSNVSHEFRTPLTLILSPIETILSSLRDGLVTLNRHWRYTYINDRQLEILKLSREAVMGKNVWDVFPDLVGTESYHQLHRAMNEQVEVQFEFYYPMLDCWVEHRVYPTADGIAILVADVSARKQAEKTLRESEERLRRAIEIETVGVIFFKTDGSITETNDAFLRMSGYSREDAEQGLVRWDEMTPPEWMPHSLRAVEEFETIGRTTPYEKEYIRKDGSRWWALFAATRLNEIEGVEFIVDITDRKRIEASLRESEQRFRDMADNAPMMVWVTDPTGYCTYLSRSWYDFSGQTEATGLGFGWLDATHPDDRESSKTIFLAANARQEAFQLEYRLRRKDGEYRTCIDAARPWFSANGEFKGYIGSVIDIDDRKQAEAALRQSEERYRTLFESIDEGFCVIEMLFDENDTPIDYRFLEINPVFEQQTGLRQAIGKTARQLVPNLEAHWIRIYGNVALTGEPARFENGSEAMNRWFDVYACRMGEPEARKVALVFKDISERKRIEQEREQLLQREQAARSAAETANRIKDEFLAVLSHELRSPLNPILGWSKLLQQRKLDEAKTKTALATIERNAQLQSQLIEDLLDISRILRGKLILNEMPVDLNVVIRAALETVRLAAEAKSVQIETTISANVGTVIGDAGRLQQVVWNLLSNAVKFTPQGGQITLTLTQTGTQAQLQVTDTGKGINPDFLPYVFDHFRQEDGATTRKFGGLGLGLAIVRQIVEMHGGTVAVNSPGEEQGATFTVQIPLASQCIELPSPERSSASTSDLSGIHILVVDDDTDSREFVTFVLEQTNAIVTTVASGFDALQAIARLIPDVIVSDIGMPDMDGYMLMRQIRTWSPEQGGRLPAVALTAYAAEFDQQQALAAGFQQHVAKPVEPDALVKAITTLIESQK